MEPKSLSFAKITKPKLARISLRNRLFSLIDQYQEHPVTWVAGPAGSGKTSLVVSYIDARKLSCLWYQVDSGDSDIASFFYYMGLAGKKAAPRRKKILPLFTPEYAQGLPIFTKRYLEIIAISISSITFVAYMFSIINKGFLKLPMLGLQGAK